MMKRSRFAVILLGTLTAFCAVGFVVAEWYFQRTLPRLPDAASGHVLLRNNHGAYVYYSQGEVMLSQGLFYAAFVFAIAGGLPSRRNSQDRNR